MEVTTVSPSPASPTEGDDLCEIDVTNVAIHSVTLLISLCGLVGNGAVLRLLSLKGRNTGIFELAFADFLFLLFTVPSALLYLVEDVSCSPIMPLLYLSFLFQLSAVSYFWALYRLRFASGINYTHRLFMLCHCDLPKRVRWLVYSVQFWAFFALFTVIPAMTNLCPSHQQEHCRAALISMYIIILLLFAAPLVIFHTVDFIKVKRGSKKQQPKRRHIVIFLIVLFILLLTFCNVLQDLGFNLVSSDVLFLLNCTHSSIKPFIYFLAGPLGGDFFSDLKHSFGTLSRCNPAGEGRSGTGEGCPEGSTRERGSPSPSRAPERSGREEQRHCRVPGAAGKERGWRGGRRPGRLWAVRGGQEGSAEGRRGLGAAIPTRPTGGQQSPTERAGSSGAAAGRESCGTGEDGDRARRGASGTGVGSSWWFLRFLLHVTDLGGAALGYGSQRSTKYQRH